MVFPSRSRWDTLASRITYYLGALFYLYQWFLLLGIAGTISSVVPQIRALLSDNSATYGFLLSVGVSVWGVMLWLKADSQRHRGYNPGLEILQVEDIYASKDNYSYTYTKKVTARALQHGVNSYTFKFQWTGTGTIAARVGDTHHTIQLLDERLGFLSRETTVYFERPLRRREMIALTFHLDLTDTGHTARPFLQGTVFDPIKGKIIFRVQFLRSSNSKPSKYKRAIFVSAVTNIPVWEEEVNLPPESYEASWEVRKPRPSYAYRITW